MTAIVGVINSQGIAIAADSALTVSGGNIKKVYNKSNKIFTLSKYHPIGIAIYNSANFMSIPLETLIKMYRASLKEKCYDTLKEYKDDFLKFLADSTKFVSQEIKAQHLYGLCNINYTTLPKNIIDAINAQAEAIQALKEKEAETKINEIAASAIKEYMDLIDGYEKSKITKIEFPELESNYNIELENIIQHIEVRLKRFTTQCFLAMIVKR